MTTSVVNLLKCPICGESCNTDEPQKRCFCLGRKQHSFDFAKSGYLNLCLASKFGDNKDAIRARSNFLEADYYLPLANEINKLLTELQAESVLDAGCGEGYYTNRMTEVCEIVFGADLSKDGIDKAAKTAKQKASNAAFAVASLFELPVKDGSFDAVTNIFAPCGENEVSRVLKGGGHLILVGAGKEHLMGLKRLLYENPYFNPERNDLPQSMKLLEMRNLKQNITVIGNDMIQALFSMTPYYWRTSEADRAKLTDIDRLETEIDFNIYIYQKDGQAK